ncbi:hypothetical protein GCK72_011313 [Caenorhabditis remanei]|uniref:SEA domain-containing protein n=1 Tax=Caenorhabditis remanei TaxID=31234 RepID=A0A6A5H5P1_CAERE|nr:hypothetical protein GCK72_011313 [Caenorhabditis remanei]KAF1763048.1 hypothetical protein GCK72_011313 [Caenorhabditis remanei]
MAYCTILYLIATVIRDCLFPKEKVEDELKKCLMVMFGMNLVVKISIMIIGWYLVDDVKTMYFFLSLEVLSPLSFSPSFSSQSTQYFIWSTTDV